MHDDWAVARDTRRGILLLILFLTSHAGHAYIYKYIHTDYSTVNSIQVISMYCIPARQVLCRNIYCREMRVQSIVYTADTVEVLSSTVLLHRTVAARVLGSLLAYLQ